MGETICCTCARVISSQPPQYPEKPEQPATSDRSLACCGRVICAQCTEENQRFQSYCPYCQISSGKTSLPAQGLREPPPYTAPQGSDTGGDPPPYVKEDESSNPQEKPDESQDVLHFLDPVRDSIASLSLAYGVPRNALRQANNLFADHLLAARKTILIPGEYYKGGVSLSPCPIESEEEEIRKSKIRRWMVQTKNADYDMALLYLQQSHFDIDSAIENFLADEQWEKDNPLKGSAKRSKQRGQLLFGGGLTGQLS